MFFSLFALFMSVNGQNQMELDLRYLTKLDFYGGDGKWHDMYRHEDGIYWINYGDPFKIIFTGSCKDLTLRVRSFKDVIVFEESFSSDCLAGKCIMSSSKMVGLYETSYYLEIIKNGSIVYHSVIESGPGGE